jgi:hypothetical protein
MERSRAAWKTGLGLLIAAVAVSALVLAALAIERFVRAPDRALGQGMALHHFERSSWFALNAERYAAIDPELTDRFRELVVWHARRAREFQRMSPGDVARESERDLEHDRSEAQLLEGKPERDEGWARAAPP